MSTRQSIARMNGPNTTKKIANPNLSEVDFDPVPYGFLTMSANLWQTVFT